MKYLDLSGGSALLPKLLGAYEQELHGPLERVLRREYRTVIDIGCAEGYYVVGLALRLPQASVYGFDLSAKSLETCRNLARLNGVSDRVHLAGRATIENLAPLIGPQTLIISDCEGGEVELLEAGRIPALRQADMIVELHDRLVPNASSIITQRFASSHEVSIVQSTDRDPGVYPLLKSLPPKQQRLALDEFRGGPMDWAVLLARNGQPQPSSS
jgi:precorrin-6B methylase 2